MLLRIVAHTPFLCLILVWTATLVAADNTAAAISSEILNYVPACARTCFESYILNNFDLARCAGSPGLQCLCQQTGLTGHTIGEGAVACIVAESSRGSCQGEDSSVETTGTAYNMCVGIAKAAPKTHPTIVATLIVPPGKGPLIAPTASRPSSTSYPATDVTSTVVPTATSPTGSPGPVAPSGTSSAAIPELDSATRENKLSPAQIVGITLGCIAVVVLGILLVLLARYVKRKRFGDTEEGGGGFTKMRDSLSFGRSQPNSPPQLQISKPLQDGPFQWHMNRMELPNAPEPAAIGLAVSPYRTQQAAATVAANRAAQRAAAAPAPSGVQTPPSRTRTPKMGNNTAKPTLSLAIPQASQPSLGVQAGTRDSIVTEFAEDGEDRNTTSTGANIWRPPPTDPQSATTYFAADKGGNWVLRTKSGPRDAQVQTPIPAQVVNTQVELPSPTDQTRAERAQRFSGWFSPGAVVQPLRVPSKAGHPKLGSPITFKNEERQLQRQQSPRQHLQPPPQQQQRGESRSSSVYSPFGAPQSVTPGPENPLPNAVAPDTYFALIRDGRDLTAAPRTKRKSLRRPLRRASGDSATSIESAAAPPFEDEDIIEDEVQVDLSPVVESPISPGKSPVRYPKIRRPASGQQPQGRGVGPQLRLFPMPSRDVSPRSAAQPGRDASASPPKRPANTGGLLGLPAHPSATRYQAQIRTGSPGLPANPSPHRNQDQPRGGSPGLPANPGPDRNGVARAASPEARGKPTPTVEQQLQRQQQYWGAQQPARDGRGPGPGPPFELPGEGPEPQWRPSQGVRQQQQLRPSPKVEQQQRRPSPQVSQQQRQQKQQQKQQKRPTQEQAPTWRPSPQPLQPATQVASPEASGSLLAKRRGADKAAALALSGNEKPSNKGWKRESIGPPPITPGIRMMTPTRKGDDLFLDVAR